MSSSTPEGEGGGNSGEEAAAPPPHILVFPFPAQGHMIPLLDFAHILSLRGLSVTVLVTPKNAPLLQPLLSRSPAVSPLVLPFPSHSSLPAGVENTQDLPLRPEGLPGEHLQLGLRLQLIHRRGGGPSAPPPGRSRPPPRLGRGAPAPPGDAADRGGGDGNGDGDGVLAWLGGRAEGSVVYVCFGSHTKLTAAQAAAVGAALERSGAGFDRREGGGAEGVAPQVAILSHPAVGSFLTHCGWNSVMEGIVAGVALLMWPMTADQFYNAQLLGELRIGIRACERADAVPDPDDLARVMAGSVDGSGSPMRARALELRREAAEATREGGDSHRQISELVDELRRLKRRPL
ncbi:unnamed protein product [Spirodela intermedia]|uniref:Uncharacterized protein n=1 Tax=Spirodela intermedia TaxID=51605 RepID=A0A7I8IU43_SPIIN|nr:unnamed protein product [Spirodela intermedia]CAA6661506.1 unnamed protein product [Spirodela intermedia]